MKTDANDIAREYGSEGLRTRLEQLPKTVLTTSTVTEPVLTPASVVSGLGSPVPLSKIWQNPPPRPPELIQGICFKGSKTFLQAPSKARKTFFQLHLSMCVATGTPWFGHEVTPGRVLYLNLELLPWSIQERARAIADKLLLQPGIDLPFDVWNLRGKKATIEGLEEDVPRVAPAGKYALIVFDPLYKLLGGRSENDAAMMNDLLLRLEAIGARTGSTILIAHHFAKGNAAGKSALDRGAGSGVLGRDTDATITLTPHTEEDCFAMEVTVRDFAPPPPTVLRWRYPMFAVDSSLSPGDLQKPNSPHSPKATLEHVLAAMGAADLSRDDACDRIRQATHCSGREAQRAFDEALSAGKITRAPGMGRLFRYRRAA